MTGFESGVKRSDWADFDCRVEESTSRFLDLVDSHNVKATFFVLGWIAERFPSLVRRIYNSGHEIGSHTYWHRLIYQQTPEEFRADLRRSKNVLEQVIGGAVSSFRAPSFSITPANTWAFEILVEEGFEVDSSLFPTSFHDRYGFSDSPLGMHQISTPSGLIKEFPMTVCRRGLWNVPVSGGGYFRLFPLAATINLLKRVNAEGRPFVFYLHPWELDPQQPRVKLGSRLTRFRHYVNLHSTEFKLDLLLANFRFGRISDVVGEQEITTTIQHDSQLATPCVAGR